MVGCDGPAEERLVSEREVGSGVAELLVPGMVEVEAMLSLPVDCRSVSVSMQMWMVLILILIGES